MVGANGQMAFDDRWNSGSCKYFGLVAFLSFHFSKYYSIFLESLTRNIVCIEVGFEMAITHYAS
jgi:hypothetical protein